VAVSVAVVAAGVFLVAFPALLIGGAAYRLFGMKRPVTAPAQRRGEVKVIDADYVVVDPGEPADRRR
jgi:hypothetical protein